eukprot:GFUD01028877.1.p1 GENE.GFUD01028877.1~~GFUD01028877.1.p1  ORF type:complete len:323 (+),score=78.62 GFUD01028877.1:100-1068(+)
MSRETTCPSIYLGISKSETGTDSCVVSPMSDTGSSPTSSLPQVTSIHDCPPIDTSSVSGQVRQYLKANQIQWTKFSTLVLGVTQSRLSTLLARPRPWHLLSKRVQGLYQRMKLWMDTKATYGNNPYLTERLPAAEWRRGSRGRPGKKTIGRKMKPRSLFELEENSDLMRRQERCLSRCGIVEELTSNNINPDVFLLGAKVVDQMEEELVGDPLSMEQENERFGESENISAGKANVIDIIVEDFTKEVLKEKAIESCDKTQKNSTDVKCEDCEAVLAAEETLSEHIISVHLTMGGLCDICGKDFFDAVGNFDMHLLNCFKKKL